MHWVCYNDSTRILSTITIDRPAHSFQQLEGKLHTFRRVSRSNRRSMFDVKPIVAAGLQGTLPCRKALHKQNSHSVVCALRISSHENKKLMRHRVTLPEVASIWPANACDYVLICRFPRQDQTSLQFSMYPVQVVESHCPVPSWYL